MLALVHGWGMDATVWDALRPRLYVPGRAVDWALPDTLPPGRFCAAGHSFGALWLLHRCADRLDGLVIINGFARFTAAPDWPGLPPRPLARMQASLAADPARVVGAFRARIGAAAPAPALAPAALAAGLAALASWDARALLAGLAVPVRVLAAPDDPLIPPPLSAATAALAGSAPVWADGGHLLPLTAPESCAAAIADVMAAR